MGVGQKDRNADLSRREREDAGVSRQVIHPEAVGGVPARTQFPRARRIARRARPTMMTRVAATVSAILLVCSVQSPWAQESRLDAPPAGEIPERYGRQVAPAPSRYWRSPDLRDYTRVLKSTEAPLI